MQWHQAPAYIVSLLVETDRNLLLLNPIYTHLLLLLLLLKPQYFLSLTFRRVSGLKPRVISSVESTQGRGFLWDPFLRRTELRFQCTKQSSDTVVIYLQLAMARILVFFLPARAPFSPQLNLIPHARRALSCYKRGFYWHMEVVTNSICNRWFTAPEHIIIQEIVWGEYKENSSM